MELEGSLPQSQTFAIRIVLSPEEASYMWVFLNRVVLRGGVVSPSPNTQAEGPPLSAVHDCLFNLFAFEFHTWINPRSNRLWCGKDFDLYMIAKVV